jgi:ribosomal protein S18 acetylase RimI-like enzyme
MRNSKETPGFEIRMPEMGPSYAIRKYHPGDREQCRRLWKELTEWHRHFYGDPTIGGDHPEDQFDDHLATVGPNRLWVATCNAAVVGLVGLIVRDTEVEVEPLIVHKGHRRHGIGEQLTHTVIAEARKLNIRYLSVKPVARNIQAIKFFHHRGFRTLGHIELFLDLSKSAWKPGPHLFDCDCTF